MQQSGTVAGRPATVFAGSAEISHFFAGIPNLPQGRRRACFPILDADSNLL
jgi:hypothetical protein